MGVMNRVVELSDRKNIDERSKRLPFHSLIPLPEILSEIFGVGISTKQVFKAYSSLIQKAGSEFNILLTMPLEEIGTIGHDILAEAIRRMRNREVIVTEGFDGMFGRIKVFDDGEVKHLESPHALFDFGSSFREPVRKSIDYLRFNLTEYQNIKRAIKDSHVNDNTLLEPQLKFQVKDPYPELNPEQRMAVEHENGPALIIAGPGTGKTRVLSHRIANLINKYHICPENILAVTFTNKAAEEMRERIINLIGREGNQNITVCTFHAFGYSILSEHFEKTGRKEFFTIIDEDDKRRLLELTGIDKARIHQISDHITQLKQELKSTGYDDNPDVTNFFLNYQSALKQYNLFDLDDLIYETCFLLMNDPAIMASYRDRFRFVLIDEYQDINYSQYRLIRLLMNDVDSNIYVIGDPNQAIYGFRGADVRFIKDFMQDYPGAQVYNLVKSYRCSDTILRVSQHMIHQGTEEFFTLSGLQKGIRVNIVENVSDKSEAEFVARTIEQMLGGLRFFSIDSQISAGIHDKDITGLSDFAVLCRIGKQMDAFEKALQDHSIPFRTYREIPFYKQEPVSIIIDLLRLFFNPENQFINQKIKNNSAIRSTHYEQLKQLLEGKSVYEAVSLIKDHYLKNLLKENEPEVRRLLEHVQDYGSDLEGFLRFVILGNPIDTYSPKTEQVSLMTIHAAKGLEFECVFITGCEDGLIPYSLFSGHEANKEEERRLLYVGMTRAMKYLWITHAKKRFLMGREYQPKRSPFLDYIEKELLEISKADVKSKAREEDRQLDLF
jgi:superfamily I DNA/RNA helicase